MKLDVFVSFRGIDTQRTFVSHLMLSLFKSWITTFKREEENQPPLSQVFQAIEESRIAIVVISKNYVASSCCLDELTKIFECMEKGSLEVVPVFYEVDPSDVLKQVDDLGEKDHGDDNLEKVKRWRNAMEKLIEIYHQKYSSWEDQDSYSYIIDEVLRYVSQCLGKSETLSNEESLYEILDDEYLSSSQEGSSISIMPQMHGEEDSPYEDNDFKPVTSSRLIASPCSLQCLCAIGIVLVAVAFRMIILRSLYAEEFSGAKPGRPLEMDTQMIYMSSSGPLPMPSPTPSPSPRPLPRESAMDFVYDIHINEALRGEDSPYEYSYVLETTSLPILQCLCAIVTMGIVLVAPALRMIAGRFMYREESSGVKHLGSFLDEQDDNYITCDNLSRFVLSKDINSFVGMNRLLKAMYTLLNLESRDETLEIGIFGEKGVGKTTLARYVYEQISPQFQDHHYINIDTTSCSLGACLLDDIARASRMEEYESLHEVVKAKLGHRKVLLIVDNIFESSQLINIRNISRWFGPGSRLVFVTSVKSLQLSERLYVVEPLRYDEALLLFSRFAFKQDQVIREYYQLSVRAVTIAGCIPLALKVFGNFLCGKHISEWELELCRLEASQSTRDCVGKVSGYIRDALS